MSAPMATAACRAARVLLAGLLAALALTSCGDTALWERWCAERALFLAQRLAHRTIAQGAQAPPRARTRAEDALRRVGSTYSVAAWLARGAQAGAARQAAVAGARAWLELGRMEAASGRDSLAVTAFTRVTASAAALPGVASDAYPALIAALDRLGRFDESLAALIAFARIEPLAEPDRPVPSPALLDAPMAVAREWRARGRGAQADSALQSADQHLRAAFARAHEPALTPLAQALARVRVARGDGAGALQALRRAAADAPPGERASRLFGMAQTALDAGLADSAITFARVVAQLDGSRSIAGRALLVQGQAWTRKGGLDSAFVAYETLLARWPDLGAIGPQARYEHAMLLDAAGRWEAARAELRSIAARYPGHPLAFTAVRQVVQHDLGHGKVELAQVTGGAELEKLARQIETDRDPEVQRQSRALQGDLQLALGRTGAAESTYVDLWRMFPADSLAEADALRAARLAEHRQGGTQRAQRLYAQLSVQARSAVVREAAAAAVAGHAAPDAKEGPR